ncbi:MAG TPA: tetratricopeptide repeat protein [Candidatus Acidoferrales bacterium]
MRSHWSPLASVALCVLLGGFNRLSAQSPATTRKRVADPAAQALNDLLNAAQAAIDKRDFAGAAQDYQQYLAKKPDDAIVHYDLGYVYSALERPADAKAEYEHAVALDPKMAAAYLNLGLTTLDRDPAAATGYLEKAAELSPKDAHTKWILGTALEKSGNLGGAIEQYQAAESLDRADFKIRLSLGHALVAAGRLGDAETEYRAALTEHASDSELADVHLGLARVLLAAKKLPEASSELALYLQSRPDDAAVRREHASMLFEMEKYDDSIADLDQAAKTRPEDLGTLKLRSDIYWKQKRYPAAVAVLQKAAALAPQDADVAARLGEAFLLSKDYPNAVHWLGAAYNMNPQANDVLAYLVDAEYGSKNFPEALAALDALSKREELPLASWYVRAVCYDNLGNLAQALDAYKKFLQLNTNQDSDMYFVATERVRVLTREMQNKKR